MTKRYFDLASNEYAKLMYDFPCDDEDFFSDYLKFNAFYDKENGLGVTHLFIEENNENKKVIGFFTLKNSSLVLREEDDGARIGYPAIEISQFATRKELQRQGIGRIMMSTIIAQAHEISNISAIKNIVLCSVKDSIGFYKKMDFNELDDKEMFIPREAWNKTCRPMVRNITIKQ